MYGKTNEKWGQGLVHRIWYASEMGISAEIYSNKMHRQQQRHDGNDVLFLFEFVTLKLRYTYAEHRHCVRVWVRAREILYLIHA